MEPLCRLEYTPLGSSSGVLPGEHINRDGVAEESEQPHGVEENSRQPELKHGVVVHALHQLKESRYRVE